MIGPFASLRRRGTVWLAAAGVAGALAALLGIRAASEGPPPTSVVVARQQLPAGRLLHADQLDQLLTTAPVPAGFELPGLLRSPAFAVGRRTVAPVAPGEPLTEAALGGAPGAGPPPLAFGERAVSVPLAAAGGAAGALSPGVRVDAVASSGEGHAGVTRIVVRGAEILAVEEGPGGVAPEAGVALLRVSSAAALRLTEALNFSREVRLLVRPPGEGPGG